MHLKSFVLALVLVFAFVAPAYAVQSLPYKPPPRVNLDEVLGELMDRIREAIERQRWENEADVNRRMLVIPGANPVRELPMPALPEREIEPHELRVLPDSAADPLRLIPENRDSEQ